jgi:DNA-binding LacI/PurR family transcriptional regulator
VLVLPLHHGEAGERQLENLIVDRICDGLCIVSYQLELPHLRVLQRCGVPCVIAGGSVSTDLESRAAAGAVRVDVDNRRYAADSVAWLHALGHRRIAFAVNEGDDPNRPHLHLLREGYNNAMKKARLSPQILMPMSTTEIGRFAKSGQATAVIVRDLPGVVRWLLALGQAGVAIPQELTLLALMEYQDYAVLCKIGETERLAFHLFQQRDIGEAAGELLVKWARGEAPDQNRVLIPTGPLGWDAEVRAALEKVESKERGAKRMGIRT